MHCAFLGFIFCLLLNEVLDATEEFVAEGFVRPLGGSSENDQTYQL
jgi:hypothetical protein